MSEHGKAIEYTTDKVPFSVLRQMVRDYKKLGFSKETIQWRYYSRGGKYKQLGWYGIMIPVVQKKHKKYF